MQEIGHVRKKLAFKNKEH